MEIRRFGDALLKSSPSPLCFLLQLPSFSRSLQYVQKSPYITLSSHYHPRRKFSTRSTLHQNSSASAGAHAPESSDHNGVSSWSSSSTGSSSAEQTEIRIKGLLDETLSDGPVRHGLSQPPNSQIKSQFFTRGRGLQARQGQLLRRVNNVVPKPALRAARTVKSRPSLGRSIEIGLGLNVGQGLRKLNKLLIENKVRSDLRKQRFHERPGLKRKRLKSERWRRRFREKFHDIVQRVQAMKEQGW